MDTTTTKTTTASTTSTKQELHNENMNTDTSSILILESCTPEALVEYLNRHRFQESISRTMDFLQQALQVATNVNNNNNNKQKNSDSMTAEINREELLGTPLLTVPLETSLLTPRAGKVSIQLYTNGYLVATSQKDPTQRLVVPSSEVSHILFFAKPEDYSVVLSNNNNKKKEPGAHLVLITTTINSNITFQNKAVSQACFALSWVKGTGPTGPSVVVKDDDDDDEKSDGFNVTTTERVGWEHATKSWRNVLETCLKQNNPDLVVAQVLLKQSTTTTNNNKNNHNTPPFVSFQPPGQSTTTGGMPFVRCYHGVNDGILYPLREGILFYKPPKFLPRSVLKSIACGRGSGGGGGQSSSRYVDMVLQTNNTERDNAGKGQSEVEFTNIQREELGVLNDYIHHVLIPAMKSDVQGKKNKTVTSSSSSSSGTTNTEAPLVVDDDDDDDADDDAESVVEVEAIDEDEDDDDDDFDDEHTDPEDENFVDGPDDEEDDFDDDDDDGDVVDIEETDDDEVEIVGDDFAKELAKQAGPVLHSAPRASRSRGQQQRQEVIMVDMVGNSNSDSNDDNNTEDENDGNNSSMVDDGDFAVVQVNSSTASEQEDDDEEDIPASPTAKRRRH